MTGVRRALPAYLTFVLLVLSSYGSVLSSGFQQTAMEAIGKSAVIVIDPRHTAIVKPGTGPVAAGTGLAFHVLRSGMTLDLARP